jgi:hypothetical protein
LPNVAFDWAMLGFKPMSAARPLDVPPDPDTMDHFVYLHGDWDDYERLLEAWAEEPGVDLEGYGSWTLKRKRQKRGAEADECYTVNRRPAGDNDRPDIAIEVISTSGGIDKLEVYRKLKVREVWFYERGSLKFFALRGERGREAYVEIAKSDFLPHLPEKLILDVMGAGTQSQTAAVRELRAQLRKSAAG